VRENLFFLYKCDFIFIVDKTSNLTCRNFFFCSNANNKYFYKHVSGRVLPCLSSHLQFTCFFYRHEGFHQSSSHHCKGYRYLYIWSIQINISQIWSTHDRCVNPIWCFNSSFCFFNLILHAPLPYMTWISMFSVLLSLMANNYKELIHLAAKVL